MMTMKESLSCMNNYKYPSYPDTHNSSNLIYVYQIAEYIRKNYPDLECSN